MGTVKPTKNDNLSYLGRASDLYQSFLETSPASKGCKKFSFDETLKSIQRHDICYFRKS